MYWERVKILRNQECLSYSFCNYNFLRSKLDKQFFWRYTSLYKMRRWQWKFEKVCKIFIPAPGRNDFSFVISMPAMAAFVILIDVEDNGLLMRLNVLDKSSYSSFNSPLPSINGSLITLKNKKYTATWKLSKKCWSVCEVKNLLAVLNREPWQ